MFALKMCSMMLRSYIELLKMRLSASVVFSAIAGYLLAISEESPHDPAVLVKLILGGFFIVGASIRTPSLSKKIALLFTI